MVQAPRERSASHAITVILRWVLNVCLEYNLTAARKRWVVYKDTFNYNVTGVPAEWHGWLNGVNDFAPTKYDYGKPKYAGEGQQCEGARRWVWPCGAGWGVAKVGGDRGKGVGRSWQGAQKMPGMGAVLRCGHTERAHKSQTGAPHMLMHGITMLAHTAAAHCSGVVRDPHRHHRRLLAQGRVDEREEAQLEEVRALGGECDAGVDGV